MKIKKINLPIYVGKLIIIKIKNEKEFNFLKKKYDKYLPKKN